MCIRDRVNYELYKELFKDFEFGKIMPFRSGTASNKWFYSLEINRDKIHVPMREIITSLEKCGIQTRAVWGLVNEQIPYHD